MSPAIVVRGLSKRFRIGPTSAPYGSLRESMTRGFRRALRLGPASPADETTLWALRDVSFDVEAGDVVGIVGRNGAGKSTLLKIISRITPPTTGEVFLRGRVGSLLEVGTGFHPELTGRENVFLNGAILGMRHREIRARFDEIVSFAEVEAFIDTPVKHYSSGMYMRLAFSVAAHLQPEILLVDEVLAVGDAEFQRKCLGKMGTAAREGRTVLFVSHNLQAVTSLCDRAIYLHGGRVRLVSDARSTVDAYLGDIAQVGSLTWRGNAGGDEFRLYETRVVSGHGEVLATDEEIRVQVFGEVLRPLYGFVCGIEVWSSQQQFLAYTAYDDSQPPPPATVQPGPFQWECVIPANSLGEGTYELRPDIGLHRKRHLVERSVGVLTLTLENRSGIGRRFTGGWTHLFRPAWPWRPVSREDPTGMD